MEPTAEELVARFRAGDPTAAQQLHDRFATEMLALVRRRFAGNQVRGALDSEGAVQDGFRSFFSAVGESDFDPHCGRVGGLLARIVSRKALVQLRRLRPNSVDPSALATVTGVVGPLLSLTAVEVEASRQETAAQLLDEFTEREQQVLVLHLDSKAERSVADIARECRRSETTVRDTIDRFYALLQSMSAAAPQPGE